MYWQKLANARKNRTFCVEHPDVKLPPDSILYETFRLDYAKYYHGGAEVAKWLIGHFRAYRAMENLTILDWGCGPGRVVRHLPSLLPSDCKIHGCDFNTGTIQWCRHYIPLVNFSSHGLSPPTSYPASKFDLIYGISVLTHLSLNQHHLWLRELHRLSRAGALVLLTTQGEAFMTKLTKAERHSFQNGELVTRSGGAEGRRTYSAFHPPDLIYQLCGGDFKIVEHKPGRRDGALIEQDVWILQKRD